MTRLILLSLTLSIAATVMAQDATTNQLELTELKSQLQTEHERIQQLLDAIQHLQQQVNQLQSGGTRDTSVQAAGENAGKQVARSMAAVESTTSSDQHLRQHSFCWHRKLWPE